MIWNVSENVKIRSIGQTDKYGDNKLFVVLLKETTPLWLVFYPPHIDPYQGKYYVGSNEVI